MKTRQLSTLYIPPGDAANESYRLATYAKFPKQVNAKLFAANGFFFSGYKDRVKCYSCGITVENWNDADNPSSNHWHLGNCQREVIGTASYLLQTPLIKTDNITNPTLTLAIPTNAMPFRTSPSSSHYDNTQR